MATARQTHPPHPLETAVWEALQEVKDPEIPAVSVVEMGIVSRVVVEDSTTPGASPADPGKRADSASPAPGAAGARVLVEATPTFVGCPALTIIAQGILRRLREVPGVTAAEVRWVMDPPWTSDRITPAGREKLRAFGLAPPAPTGADALPGRDGDGACAAAPLVQVEEAPACPYCGSTNTHLENLFGPTACRSIYYCDNCRNPFEAMKQV